MRALAALHGMYGAVLGLGGDPDAGVRYSREATRLADQTKDQGLQLAERCILAWGCLYAGRLAEGIEVCDTAHQSLPADPTLGAEFMGTSPFHAILRGQVRILCLLGRISEATAVCERAEALIPAHGDNEVLTWLQILRIELDVIYANPTGARDHARRALQAAEKVATPQAHIVALIVLGIAHRLNEQWDEAVAALQESVSASTGVDRLNEGSSRAELAEALLGRGDLDRAEHEAQAAVTLAHARHFRWVEIKGNLALAHTQLRRADSEGLVGVEQALVRAQELIDETGARAYQPQVHECRAQLALLLGDTQTARHELDVARRLYAEMGATAQVERLAREIDGCGRQASLAEPGAES
jgi:tetratricopeptide (TPR) repeat protein